MSKSITLPKHFANYLSGSDIVIDKTGDPDWNAAGAYPAHAAIAAAWHDAVYQRRGGMTLMFNDEDWADALDCLDDYAATSYRVAQDVRSTISSRYEPETYRECTAEIDAARRVRNRIRTLRGLPA